MTDTTEEVPMKVVVDCSVVGGSHELSEKLRLEAADCLAKGDVAGAQNILAQAMAESARANIPVAVRIPLTEEELHQRELDAIESEAMQVGFRRGHRNALLAASDWTALPDVALDTVTRGLWLEYRQALRDLTFDTDPVWPAAPGGE